jgi:hypothetical protein
MDVFIKGDDNAAHDWLRAQCIARKRMSKKEGLRTFDLVAE